MEVRVLCRLVLIWIGACFAIAGNAQSTLALKGKVIDQYGKPVIKASLRLLNTHATAITNADGYFTIEDLSPGNYQLEISAIGYADKVEAVEVSGALHEPYVFELSSAAVQLESVTVTADKREAPLHNVPSSITALGDAQVLDLRLWNIKDVSGVVPNLYSGNSGDWRNVTSIRGITTTSYDPAVATYVDGVNQFSLDTYIPQLSDIERIEVLRGPQGTLYGRNAMGGVINIITKQPTNISSGFIELNIGNYGLQRYSAGMRLPIVKDKLFFGVAGTYAGLDGFYKNEYNNLSFDDQDALTGNYYLKYLPGHHWSITLNAKHQNNHNDGAFPLVNGVEEAFNNPYKLSQNAVGKMIDNTFNGSLSIVHNGKVMDISSQTSFQNNHRYYDAPLDGDFSPVDAITVINDYGNKWNNVKVVTQEFRLSSPANKSEPANWTAGAYFFHNDNPVKQATHFGADAGLLGFPDTNFSIINTTKATGTGAAFYGQLHYSITKKLSVTGGLRYDYEQKDLSVNGAYQADGQQPFTTVPDTSGSVHYNALSPKLGLQYTFNAKSNIYTNYSRGFRTGGLTQLSLDPSQPPLYPFKPEYSNNFELGIKNNLWNSRLRINAAFFLTYVNDAQVPTLILPEAITVTRNTGSLVSKGAELEISAKPFRGFQLDYNAGYTRARYKSLKVSSDGQEVNLNGKRQIFTPDVTSMLALQYAYNLATFYNIKLVVRGEWYYMGERYFDLANNIRQSPYNLLNARFGVSSKNVDVFFWGRNLGEIKYMEYAYDFGAIHLAAPRTYGVTIRTMF